MQMNADTTQDECKICTDPNKYAPKAFFEETDKEMIIHGYQEYSLSRNWTRVAPKDTSLRKKKELLSPFFSQRYLKKRSILDLGANGGFYSFWALQEKAERATAVDMDESYINIINKAKQKFNFRHLVIKQANVSDWQEPADVVVALALVHWVYSCTALLGSLEAVVDRLAQLTNYMLIVEWIEPADQAIQFFGHTAWNKDVASGPYTLEAFELALSRNFQRSKMIGEVSPTRRLYVAFKNAREIDLSGPLPLIKPKDTLVSSRLLAQEDGIQYWSLVYDDGKNVYKEATLDLAQREAAVLSEFDCDFFPRALGSWLEPRYSVAVLEKILGKPLKDMANAISQDVERMTQFIGDCLRILLELKQKGVTHRDIRQDNMLVREGRPVLIDFGWAASETHPYCVPKGLGDAERPPDGSFCDVYSMGRILEQTSRGRYPKFDEVIGLMTEPDAYLRVTDLQLLRLLFEVASKREAGL